MCQSDAAAAPGAPVSQTLDITLLGDTGVANANGTNPANAVVSDCSTGAIRQSVSAAPLPGDVDNAIVNGTAGDVNVQAIATATNTLGNATAFASISTVEVIRSRSAPAR